MPFNISIIKKKIKILTMKNVETRYSRLMNYIIEQNKKNLSISMKQKYVSI